MITDRLSTPCLVLLMAFSLSASPALAQDGTQQRKTLLTTPDQRAEIVEAFEQAIMLRGHRAILPDPETITVGQPLLLSLVHQGASGPVYWINGHVMPPGWRAELLEDGRYTLTLPDKLTTVTVAVGEQEELPAP
ncbi:MAG: hypothetical protein Alpg2KO_13430 [Alphaproteobacteria bacterium]